MSIIGINYLRLIAYNQTDIAMNFEEFKKLVSNLPEEILSIDGKRYQLHPIEDDKLRKTEGRKRMQRKRKNLICTNCTSFTQKVVAILQQKLKTLDWEANSHRQ